MTDGPVNVAAQLESVARRLGEKLAVVECDRRWTFTELDAACDRYAHGLSSAGIGRSTRVVLMVRPGLEFFALTFALLRIGAVLVMVDPGIGRKHLGRCLAEAQPEAFIGIPLAQLARVVLGWGRATIRTTVTAGRRWLWGGHSLGALDQVGAGRGPYKTVETRPGDVAAILFTSGSTGSPKGAIYTHAIFDAQVRQLREHFGMGAQEIDLPTFPLFALFDAVLGLTAVIPRMDFTRPGDVDPREIVRPILRHGITQMFGSPALLDRVGRYGESEGVKLPTLGRVISAGAPVSPRILERFTRMLPATARVHTPYGATEALPVASIDSSVILGETRALTDRGKGTCVGAPLPGMDVRIIRIDDGPIETWTDELVLPDGEIGEIAVRGPVASHAYYGRPEATRLAKIPMGPDAFFHRMGDLGYRDGAGRIWFCGRKSQRVVTGAGTLFTVPCEAIFNVHPRVRRTALVGVGPPGRQRPVLCVEAEESADEGSLRRELLELGQSAQHTRGIADVLFASRLPVDVRHNAKIRREDLAIWAARTLGDHTSGRGT